LAQEARECPWFGAEGHHATGGFLTHRVFAASFVLAGFVLAGTISAHHSPSAVFDMTKPFVVKGTLTKVDWVNPHINLFIDAQGADGTTEAWKIESQPPSWFRHVGLARADIAKAIGQSVTIAGVRARDGSRYAYLQKLTFADGDSIELERGNAEAKP
jgi:hypothetical protein